MIFYRQLAVCEKQSLILSISVFQKILVKILFRNRKIILKAETHQHFLKKIGKSLRIHFSKTIILVEISEQKLYLLEHGGVLRIYPVSTSRFGVGNRRNSFKTPLGAHVIENKIGRSAPMGAVFINRKKTCRIAKINHDRKSGTEDFITSRILRLKGLEIGVNKGRGIQSYDRFIYIHGTNEEGLIGQPVSHGCVRMKNQDVIELFDLIKKGTLVYVIK